MSIYLFCLFLLHYFFTYDIFAAKIKGAEILVHATQSTHSSTSSYLSESVKGDIQYSLKKQGSPMKYQISSYAKPFTYNTHYPSEQHRYVNLPTE